MKAHLLPLLPPHSPLSLSRCMLEHYIISNRLHDMAATTKCIKKKNAPSPVSASQKLKFEFFNVFIGNLFLIKNQRNQTELCDSLGVNLGLFAAFFLRKSCVFISGLRLKKPATCVCFILYIFPVFFLFLTHSVASTRFCRVKFLFSHLQRCFYFWSIKKRMRPPPHTWSLFIYYFYLLFYFIIIICYFLLLLFDGTRCRAH